MLGAGLGPLAPPPREGAGFGNLGHVTPASTNRQRLLQPRGVFLDPLTKKEAGRWFLLALGGFLMGQILSALAVSLTAAALGHSAQLTAISHEAAPPNWYVISSLLGLWAGFLGAPALALRYAGPFRRHLGLAFRPIDLLGIPLGIGLQIIVGLAYQPFLKHLQHFNAPIQKLTGGSHGTSYVLILAMTAVGAPIVEEIFFRGLLFRSLAGFATSLGTPKARNWGIVGAMVLDGLLFGAAHGELAQWPGLAFVGIMLSLIYYVSGRLGMNILTHVAFNSVALVAYTNSGVIRWLH